MFDIAEELKEHELKDKDMKPWLKDAVMRHPDLKEYTNGVENVPFKDKDKELIVKAFESAFTDAIGAKMWKVFGGKEGIRKAFYSVGCYEVLGDLAFTDREDYYTHEKIPAETSPEQLCADWDNFVSQMGFDGAPEWAMELLYQRGYYKYYAAGNTSWSNPGGRNPKRTYADMKAAMSKVSAVAENSKITLTIGQLKKLIKECHAVNESYRHFTQKELRKMVRDGEATDITAYSFDQAKEIRHRGYDIVGVCTGVYGLTGALLKMNDTGEFCAVIARNTILSYLV